VPVDFLDGIPVQELNGDEIDVGVAFVGRVRAVKACRERPESRSSLPKDPFMANFRFATPQKLLA